MQTTASKTDDLLLPFLVSTEGEEQALLTHLITEHIDPTIRQVFKHKLRFYCKNGALDFHDPNVEELYHDIQLHLLKRLRELKRDPFNNPVSDLRAYTATTARNACDEYFRRKYPRRRNLKDKIRYHLIGSEEFELWEESNHLWFCGLAAWGAGLEGGRARYLSAVLDARLKDVNINGLKLDEMLTAIFQLIGEPVELDHLTSIVAELWGIEDHPATPYEEAEPLLSERMAMTHAMLDAGIEQRQLLQQLWVEICQLSRRQRVALLFNLRSPQGINIITLLPATGLATFEQIAHALEIPPKQFEAIWANLPMDDLSIGRYLGATRQQVINLRKNARARLARRMKMFEDGFSKKRV
ncbi:MAG: hypothetical protein WCF57_24620 [Pyrinomonadaceae bacterium]